MTTGASIYLVSACSSGEEFVAAFRRYADRTGLFIPVADPLPAGRRGRIALTLKDGGVMIEGEVEVIACSAKPSALHGRIGMTIRFVEPDEPSKIVLAELEKARLAMKPAAPSVAPRPSDIPPDPRPVPPAPGGRIDANNALAECVLIGDVSELRDGGGSAAEAGTAAPPKASQRFVVPSIPQVGGAARPKSPSTSPEPRTNTPSLPGSKPTTLGMSPIKMAVAAASSDAHVASEAPAAARDLPAKDPAREMSEISVPRTTTVPGVAPADSPATATRKDSAIVRSGTVPGVAPVDRAAGAADPPGLATPVSPIPVPLTTVPGTAAPVRTAPAMTATTSSESEAYPIRGHGRGPRMTMMGPAVAAPVEPERVVPGTSAHHPPASPGSRAQPAAPTLPSGHRVPSAAMGRSKSATSPPRFPTPVAPLPVTRLPARPASPMLGKPAVAAIADVDLAEPTDLNAVPEPPAVDPARRTTSPREVVSRDAASSDSGRGLTGDGPTPAAAWPPTDRPMATSTRASQILAAIPGGGDWTMTPDASVPTVLSSREGSGADALRTGGPIHDDLPAIARASSGDWTISLTSDEDAVWSEPQKAELIAPTTVAVPAHQDSTGRSPGSSMSGPAQRKVHPAATPTTGNAVFAVAGDRALSSEAPEERATAIEPKVEIDPTLMEPLIPIPEDDADEGAAAPALAPPPMRVGTARNNIPPPLAPMPMPRQVPMELRSQAGQTLAYTTPVASTLQHPPGPALQQPLGSQVPSMTFPPPHAPGVDAGAGFFGPDSGGIPSYDGAPTIAADLPRRRTRTIMIVGGALSLIAIMIALIVVVRKGDRHVNGTRSSRAPGSGSTAAIVPPSGAGSGTREAPTGSGSGAQQVAVAEPDHTETSGPDAGVVASAGTCTVEITSVPSAAEVALDNTRDHVLGTTPTTVELPCGAETKLYLRKAKYVSAVKAVTATAENTKLRVIKLSRPSFALKVTSSPAGATITVGGKSLGVTPTTVKLPAFDAAAITVAKDGYTSDTQRVAIKTNNGAHHVVLKKLGGPKKPH